MVEIKNYLPISFSKFLKEKDSNTALYGVISGNGDERF